MFGSSKKRVDEFADKIAHTESVSKIRHLSGEMFSELGFRAFLHFSIPRTYQFEFSPVFVSNISRTWIEHYYNNNFAANDWLIEWCMNQLRTLVFDVEVLPDSVRSDRDKFRVMEHMNASYPRGLAFPYRTGRMTSGTILYTNASRNEMDRQCQTNEALLYSTTSLFHQRMAELGFSSLTESVKLTNKEHNVLARKANGLTSKEIAVAMGIAEVTVNFHWRNIGRKIGAESSREIVPKALGYGLCN